MLSFRVVQVGQIRRSKWANLDERTHDALVFAARALKGLTPEKHARLMEAHLKLRYWPDVRAALSSLKKSGIRLAFLQAGRRWVNLQNQPGEELGVDADANGRDLNDPVALLVG
jgi:hypothetical protein